MLVGVKRDHAVLSHSPLATKSARDEIRRSALSGQTRVNIVRFVDFIILVSALVTAGSTFAMAVEIVVGWDEAVPVVEQAIDDSGLTEYLPTQTGEATPVAE